MINLAIVHLDDNASDGRQDRSAERDKSLHRLGGKEGPPINTVRRPTAMINTDKVDGIACAQQVSSVTGHSPLGAVLSQPSSLEGECDDDLCCAGPRCVLTLAH